MQAVGSGEEVTSMPVCWQGARGWRGFVVEVASKYWILAHTTSLFPRWVEDVSQVGEAGEAESDGGAGGGGVGVRRSTLCAKDCDCKQGNYQPTKARPFFLFVFLNRHKTFGLGGQNIGSWQQKNTAIRVLVCRHSPCSNFCIIQFIHFHY